jgi:hypothetical protein
VAQGRVELRQRLAAVALGEEVRKGIAQTDNRVELAVNSAIQPTPIRLHGGHYLTSMPGVFERLGQHLGTAVGAQDLKALLQQTGRVKTGTRGDVEDLFGPTRLELFDKKSPLAVGAAVPVDQLIPFVHKAVNVLLLIMLGTTHLYGIFSKTLFLSGTHLQSPRLL